MGLFLAVQAHPFCYDRQADRHIAMPQMAWPSLNPGPHLMSVNSQMHGLLSLLGQQEPMALSKNASKLILPWTYAVTLIRPAFICHLTGFYSLNLCNSLGSTKFFELDLQLCSHYQTQCSWLSHVMSLSLFSHTHFCRFRVPFQEQQYRFTKLCVHMVRKICCVILSVHASILVMVDFDKHCELCSDSASLVGTVPSSVFTYFRQVCISAYSVEGDLIVHHQWGLSPVVCLHTSDKCASVHTQWKVL